VLVVSDQEFAERMNSKQRDFFRLCNDPTAEEILFDGSIRAGKTQAACKIIAAWAWKYGGPNWRWVILRKTYRELADSTQAAFWRGDGKMPPACPPELISRYYAKDEEVILKNGARIMFRSAEQAKEAENKIRNVTLAGFFIDQVEEFDGPEYFHLYETLLSRLSDPRGPRKGLLVANPGAEDHWVHRRFVDPLKREPQTRRVSVTLYDNAHNLPESYVTRMTRRGQTNPLFYRRYILGEWGAFGGKRFPAWDPDAHTCAPINIGAGWEIIRAIDYGWADPTAVVWCAIDYEGRWWVFAEHYENEKPISHHARKIKEIETTYGITTTSSFLDPSAFARKSEYQSIAQELADHNIHCGRAQNDRIGGWNRIEEMMIDTMPDGLPRLRIFRTCENLIRELPSLKIKEGTNDVDDKQSDHAADALRYAIMTRMPAPEEDDEDEELGPREAYAKRLYERAMGREEEKLRMV